MQHQLCAIVRPLLFAVLGVIALYSAPINAAEETQQSSRDADIYQTTGAHVHPLRYPAELTSDQWETVLMHMRVRAPLTAERHRAILRYLTDASNDNQTPASNMLLKGSAFAQFKWHEGDNSTFAAGFDPLFLWRFQDKLLFEGKLDISVQESDTFTELQYAAMDYICGDYLTIRAGKFLLPIGIFKEKIYPAWINKLPTNPLPYTLGDDGLLPETDVGVRGRPNSDARDSSHRLRPVSLSASQAPRPATSIARDRVIAFMISSIAVACD